MLLRERDTDKDGKLNFNEFFHGIFDLIRDYDEGYNASHSTDSMEAPAKKIFADLDHDKDGYNKFKMTIGSYGKQRDDPYLY